jgi:hypothetical protein
MEIKEVKTGGEDFRFRGDDSVRGNGGGGGGGSVLITGVEGLTVLLKEAKRGERLGTMELTVLHFGARTGDVVGPVELSMDGDVERVGGGGGGARDDGFSVVGISSDC